MASATASALAESIAQSASMGKAATDHQDNQQKNPAINKPGKLANAISKSALVDKANPSTRKSVPIKPKSPLAFGSIPSSSFEPVLLEQPQELKWDVLHEEKPVGAYQFQRPVSGESNNTLPTDEPEQEMRGPLIDTMSTAPTSHSGLFTIPPDMMASNQSAPKQGLFTFSTPSTNLSPPTAKEGLFSFPTKCNDSNTPNPIQSLASLTPETESFNLFDQSRNGTAMDTPCVPLEGPSDSTAENIANVTPDDVPMTTGEVAPEQISGVNAAHDSEVILVDRSEALQERLLLRLLARWTVYGDEVLREVSKYLSNYRPPSAILTLKSSSCHPLRHPQRHRTSWNLDGKSSRSKMKFHQSLPIH